MTSKAQIILAAAITMNGLFAHAEVSVSKHGLKHTDVTIQITGDSAVKINQILESGMREKMLSAPKADESIIQSISCSDKSCSIVVAADAYKTADAKDLEYLNEEFVKKVAQLKPDQVLILAPQLGTDAVSNIDNTQIDSHFMRALLRARHDLKDIIVSVAKNDLRLKNDQVAVPILTAELKLKDITITCYSTLETEVGQKNFLTETCSIETIATER